jgi:hypothetical protein
MPPACAGRSRRRQRQTTMTAQRRTKAPRGLSGGQGCCDRVGPGGPRHPHPNARRSRWGQCCSCERPHGPRRSGDGRNRRPDERAEGGRTRVLWNVQPMSGKSFGAPAPATRYAALARPRHAACLTPSTMMARLSDYWDSRPRPGNTDAWNSTTAAPNRPSSARSLSPGRSSNQAPPATGSHSRRPRQTPTTSTRSPSGERACAADTGPPAELRR